MSMSVLPDTLFCGEFSDPLLDFCKLEKTAKDIILGNFNFHYDRPSANNNNNNNNNNDDDDDDDDHHHHIIIIIIIIKMLFPLSGEESGFDYEVTSVFLFNSKDLE